MRDSLKKGFGFGLTSGVITTLGMIVGLHSAVPSKTVIIGGILTIAFADAFSDAMGTHISEEFEGQHSAKEVWEATLSTFLSKLLFAITFVLPVWFLPLSDAITVSIMWGLLVIAVFSYFMAKQQEVEPYKIIIEHLFIAIIVVLLTHQIGDWIASLG
jgi:VIT1/CCC1 family predicted Fe2+/Mn2+ transporter